MENIYKPSSEELDDLFPIREKTFDGSTQWYIYYQIKWYRRMNWIIYEQYYNRFYYCPFGNHRIPIYPRSKEHLQSIISAFTKPQ